MSVGCNPETRHQLSACLARDPTLVAVTARHFRDFLLESGLADAEAFQLRLILSEVLNNLVEHAPADQVASGIDIRCWLDERFVHLEIRDSGPAMGDLPQGDLPDGLSERGRGWPIIRHWADEISYCNHRDSNILAMKKALVPAEN